MGPLQKWRRDYLAASWQRHFEGSGLDDFESLWRLKLPLVDAANTTRGGLSTVAILATQPSGHETIRLVVKRQHNHQSRTWRHPLRGVPTLLKEFLNIRRFDQAGLATLTPVYFAKRRDGHGNRAILITEFLEGYRSFDKYLENWALPSDPQADNREAILRQTADLIARMHRAGFRHNCLYPKHVFVNPHAPCPDVRIIDLEKAGRSVLASRRKTRDLGAFFRRSAFWKPSDQEHFLVCYHGAREMTPEIARSMGQIRQAMDAKTKP